MINVADLPAVRAQAARSKAEDASQALATETPQPPSQDMQLMGSSKPSLALDKGHYYVVDNEK
jgi:hypothetical protein